MSRPNVVVMLADDLGYSDLGCYGGEISTPVLDSLAAGGVRLTQFYNTARCSPSRASLLTGLHPHQTGIGVLTGDDSPVGYPGSLNRDSATAAEVLRSAGYATALTGKWHLAADTRTPDDSWPTRRGFDYFYGTLSGCGSYFSPATLHRDEQNIEHEADDPQYYYTDAITEEAASFIERSVADDRPFFLYTAYTAPHWPLHARAEDVDRYAGRFDAGWDSLRTERLERQRTLGIVDPDTELSPRDPDEECWEQAADQAWQARRMEVYAAQVDRMDQGVGRIIATLERLGQLDNTIVIFLSDNGASPEELPHMRREKFVTRSDIYRDRTRDGEPVGLGNTPEIVPGPENSYASYGRPWANLSNTPFRRYKKWTHQGGIAAPFIVHWPAGQLAAGQILRTPHQLTDVLPTVLDAVGVDHPAAVDGRPVLPLEGHCFLTELRSGPTASDDNILYWEHCGNAAIRQGRWKLVREHPHPWELYDLEQDPTELDDVSADQPELAERLLADWSRWADRVGVLPFDRIENLYLLRGESTLDAAG